MNGHLSILVIASAQEIEHVRALIHHSIFHGSKIYTKGATHRHFDLIITDLQEGLASIAGLKKSYPGTPILYLGDDEVLAKQAVIQGVQDFLPRSELTAQLFSRVITYSIQREEIKETLREKLFTDELTGIYNRRGFSTVALQQMGLAKRTGQGFLLFLIDLDFFKQINDQHGHLAGDQALIATATCLKEAFRQHDIIGRIGGDEFAVIAVASLPEHEESLRKHLVAKFKELNASAAREYVLSCSIGCAAYGGEEIAFEQLLNKADQNLYQEKKVKHSLRS